MPAPYPQVPLLGVSPLYSIIFPECDMQTSVLLKILLLAKTDFVIRPRTEVGFLDKTLDRQDSCLWQRCGKVRRNQQTLW